MGQTGWTNGLQAGSGLIVVLIWPPYLTTNVVAPSILLHGHRCLKLLQRSTSLPSHPLARLHRASSLLPITAPTHPLAFSVANNFLPSDGPPPKASASKPLERSSFSLNPSPLPKASPFYDPNIKPTRKTPKKRNPLGKYQPKVMTPYWKEEHRRKRKILVAA
ncbi:hypothetical protein COLO4_07106 [Corchorus olitorius]|uniref:Uncharacterized protein n=1 Tax=Corchorus olitorius TaxID=93759 RepID=A0A1R3KL37_9ROSI|nr:hypothetical protein COLO4_07106 [Corchorus olitorius]